jgi:uncharacterized protein YlaI
MDVKKCDRCGTIFSPSAAAEISFRHPNHAIRTYMDLCAECKESFIEWANEKKVVIK